MSGTFFGFNTALKGLFAQQKAMNTTAHNIANAGTEGYTRQQAVMEATPAFAVPSMSRPGGSGQVGTGVNVNEIRRIRDVFLDTQIRNELAGLGEWEQKSETLRLAETVFIEPSDDGLSSIFDEFWKGWQELSKNAENIPIRTSLKETAISLADAIKHSYNQLNTVVTDLKRTAEIKALAVNTLATQINDLNQQIATIQLSGDSPNDLKDQRDNLLDKLARLIDFTPEDTTVERPVGVTKNPDGTFDVAMGHVPDGQIRIYMGDPATKIEDRKEQDYLVYAQPNKFQTIAYSEADKEFKWMEDASTVPPTLGDTFPVFTGELFGLMEVMAQIEEYISDLNELAENLATAVNEKHLNGVDLDGQQGEQFFYFDSGNAAGTIKVNAEITKDVTKIAASIDSAGGHDGGVALEIAKLRPGIDRQYDQLVSRIGVKTNEAIKRRQGQEVLLGQLESRKESISGVSLDEEMAFMMQYQRAYQAAATIITTLDEMVQTILALKR
ncbi:MAG: flagellar hook-associated protein FlgK [Bacillota bacterium]